MPVRYAADLAPQQALDEATKILARDRAKFIGTNPPVYRGQTISPMSSLTQKARTLQNGFDAKTPYAGKINQVLTRPNQGINPQELQGFINSTGQQQQFFSRHGLSDILENQFRGAYNPSRFLRKSDKDIRSNLGEVVGQLSDIQRSSGVLEQSSNQALIDKLKTLQYQKQDRRKALVGSLEQFGAQKHGYNNLVNAVNRNSFEQEANAPFRRMDMLHQALTPLSQNMDPDVLPEIKENSGKQALQALRAYGVNTNGPVDEWVDARNARPSYPKNLISDLPPEIQASHKTLELLDPKFKSSQYAQQKALIRQMMSDQSIGDTAMNAVPDRMRGQVNNLESAAEARLKRDLAAINNQFIQANQYGSPLHIKTAEDRAREVSKSTMEQRTKLLEDSMKSELSLRHQQQQANLRQVGSFGDQAQKEYEEMLNSIRSMNNTGATKFANEQSENEDLYKNFQNESAWEWPHLRGAIAKESRQGALSDVFRGMEARNISLDNLAALNTRYSESQREAEDFRNQLQARDSTIADLQRRLNGSAQQPERPSIVPTQIVSGNRSEPIPQQSIPVPQAQPERSSMASQLGRRPSIDRPVMEEVEIPGERSSPSVFGRRPSIIEPQRQSERTLTPLQTVPNVKEDLQKQLAEFTAQQSATATQRSQEQQKFAEEAERMRLMNLLSESDKKSYASFPNSMLKREIKRIERSRRYTPEYLKTNPFHDGNLLTPELFDAIKTAQTISYPAGIPLGDPLNYVRSEDLVPYRTQYHGIQWGPRNSNHYIRYQGTNRPQWMENAYDGAGTNMTPRAANITPMQYNNGRWT